MQKELGFAAKKANCNAVYAPISSGDQFISTSEQRRAIAPHLDSLCYDMESAPMGQIAFVYKIKYCAIRVITDCENSGLEYALNLPKAVSLLAEIISHLFE